MINILTCSEANNYGTVLQTYATQKVFQELGEDVTIIDYRCKSSNSKQYSIKNANTIKSKIAFIIFYFHRKRKSISFDFFKTNFIAYTEKKYYKSNMDELISYMNQSSCICIGSDQVWNPEIQDIKLFTLEWINEHVRKVSFASSMGNSYVNNNISNILRSNLSKFDELSVREEGEKAYLESITHKKIERILDPTLLLDDNFWRRIEKKANVPSKYIFLYLASNSTRLLKYAYYRAKKNHCKLLVLSDIYYPIPSFRVKNLEGISPENFLFLIDHAVEVYTNSYHGLVFSINFKKNFGVENPIDRDDRIGTVLDVFGLQEKEICYKNTEKINYEEVYKILTYERLKADAFLKRIIQG